MRQEADEHLANTAHGARLGGATEKLKTGANQALLDAVQLARALADGGLLLYETFMVGNEQFGRPRNPEFLLRDGELRAFATEHGLEELAFSQGEVGAPPSAVRQRLLARRRAVT